MSTRRLRLLLVVPLGIAMVAAGCGEAREAADTGGDAARGGTLMTAYGCGACHSIPDVRGADADIGPDLADLADRRTIAGRLPNTPANVIRWIEHPQEIEPGTIMPDLDVPEPAARDIAAYLYAH